METLGYNGSNYLCGRSGRSKFGNIDKSTKGRSNLGNFVKSTRKEDLILATCSKSAIHTQSTSCGKDDIGGLQQNIPTVAPFWRNWPTRSKSNLFHRKEVLRKVTHKFLRKKLLLTTEV